MPCPRVSGRKPHCLWSGLLVTLTAYYSVTFLLHKTVVLKHASELSGRLIKGWLLVAVSRLWGLGWAWGFCVSSKFPGNTDTGPTTTLGELLVCRKSPFQGVKPFNGSFWRLISMFTKQFSVRVCWLRVWRYRSQKAPGKHPLLTDAFSLTCLLLA